MACRKELSSLPAWLTRTIILLWITSLSKPESQQFQRLVLQQELPWQCHGSFKQDTQKMILAFVYTSNLLTGWSTSYQVNYRDGNVSAVILKIKAISNLHSRINLYLLTFTTWQKKKTIYYHIFNRQQPWTHWAVCNLPWCSYTQRYTHSWPSPRQRQLL